MESEVFGVCMCVCVCNAFKVSFTARCRVCVFVVKHDVTSKNGSKVLVEWSEGEKKMASFCLTFNERHYTMTMTQGVQNWQQCFQK